MFTNLASTEFVNELTQAGVVLGHKKAKTHPRMRQYISGTRQEIELLDPEAIQISLEKAAAFLKGKLEKGGFLLCVGTSPAAKDAIEVYATANKYPFVNLRWLGGTLTNHKVIMGRIKHYLDLKTKREAGDLVKYTKKEQSVFSKEIGKLEKSFSGLLQYTRMPDALLVVDPERERTAIAEARLMKIPVVAIMDTNDNPDLAEYPIFANDHSKTSIEWVLGKLDAKIKPITSQ
jgi:small subunit ribosomal protein S2